MKKIIILSASFLLAVTICIGAFFTVTGFIQASGPKEDDKPLIMVNDKLYQTTSSCAQAAFDNIVQSEGFALSELTIKSTVKGDETPTTNLSTNFVLFKKKEIYLSENKPDEIYIKTVVNNEIRYYLFEVADIGTDAV